MNHAPTRAEDDAVDPAAQRMERQSHALKAVADIGVELARALADQVASRGEGPFRNVDPSLAFSRIARAIRLTIVLENRLAQEHAGWERGLPARDAGETPALREEDDDHEDLDTHTERGIPARNAGGTPALLEEDADETEPAERPERETFREDLSEAAIESRPSAELYALACRDLGLTPEPDLFEAAACNDDAPQEGSADTPPEPAPARRAASASGRAALLRSAAAGPMTGAAPGLSPFPRPPP